jgi:hypothetical protein
MIEIWIGGKRNLSDGTWDDFRCGHAVKIDVLSMQLKGDSSKVLL